MPVISFASPKGGAGKTTASILLASELVQRGLLVTIIDCDPSQWCVHWTRAGEVQGLSVIPKPREEAIIDAIDQAGQSANFVIVDLEGTSSLLVAYALSRSDLVVIPTQAGPMEGQSASNAIKLIRQQEKGFSRKIPFAVLMTRVRAAIRTNIETDLLEQLQVNNIPLFSTRLMERNAFKEILRRECMLADLPSSTYKLDDARRNARSFADEVVEICRSIEGVVREG